MDTRRLQFADEVMGLDQYHMPHFCDKCGGVMVFKGVGEYRCEDCGEVAYDDYGKVRIYLEKHKGATAAEVESETGVKQKTIRLMLKESRLEVTEDSKAFMICEFCGKRIRSGRLCPQCEAEHHRNLEEKHRQLRNENVQVHGLGKGPGEEGERRFSRK